MQHSQMVRIPDGTTKVLIEGVERVQVVSYGKEKRLWRLMLYPCRGKKHHSRTWKL